MAFPLIAFNTAFFLAFGVYALTVSYRQHTWSLRKLWAIAAIPAFAVVLGGIQRMVLQATRLGWLSESTTDLVVGPWQAIQSVVVATLALIAVFGIRRLTARLNDLEVVVGQMVDRVAGIHPDGLGLTPRELEVLMVIGASSHIDDKSLAEKLGVSPDTAHTHVGRLLKKAKLHDRRDLQIVAFVMTQQSSGHSPS